MKKRQLSAVLLALAGLFATATPALAQSAAPKHYVNTTNDTADANPGDGSCADAHGRCSLRAAVQEANAGGTDAMIRLRTATYQLSIGGSGEDAAATGDLDVTGKVTIKGQGAVIDLDGFGDRAFDVSATGNLTVSTLTIKNGAPAETESGGAYRSAGTLNLDQAGLINNVVTGAGASGGAIANLGGTLKVQRSLLWNNAATRAGGAIEANAGTTVVMSSTLNGNSTGPMPGNGGALHLTGEGTVEVGRSTVTNNIAASEGGGLWNSASGTMTITSSLIDSNRADGIEADTGGGGLFNDGGEIIVDRTTVSNNVANEGSASGGGVLNDEGQLTIMNSGINNNVTSRAGGGVETRAGSVMIDRTTLDANVVGTAPGNGGALHAGGAAVVTVKASNITNNIAGAEGGGLWNSSTGTMTAMGTTITHNRADGTDADQGGGGVFNDGGAMVLDDVSINRNQAIEGSGSGGGVFNNEGSLTVSNSEINHNATSRAGGAIETKGGSVEIARVSMVRNDAGASPGNGGALHVSGEGSVSIDRSILRKNVAGNEGGGVWNSAIGTMTIANTNIMGNEANGTDADNGGGGVFNQGNADGTSGGTLTIRRSTIANNTATQGSGSGGGILNEQGTMTLERVSIRHNAAARAGGGIEVVGGADGLVGTTSLKRVNLKENTAGPTPGNGGGLHISAAGTVTIDKGAVFGNHAANEGGGLWNSPSGVLTVNGTSIRDNTAGVTGPNVYQKGPVSTGSFSIDGQTVAAGPNTK